jgi:F-type H+-transporting ATPase subunit gamma
MANTLSLRRRIKTAQNVSKTTRAMQMIAASKLKRAQYATVASRPYVTELTVMAQKLSPMKKDEMHPYIQEHFISGKTLYVIISPDKGLCGGLITNLIREYFKIRNDEKALFITVGKKIEASVASTNKNLIASFPFGNTLPLFEQVLPIIAIINDYYLHQKVDKVKIITSKFNSVFSQTPHITDLLPIRIEEKEGMEKTGALIFEPSRTDLVPELLKRYIEMVMYQQFLESYASYNAAQMIAMQNATNNAKDIVSELQLLYNKARQEKITKEILDISSAAVALAEE